MARCRALKAERLRLYKEYVQPLEGLIESTASTSHEEIASVSNSADEGETDETIPAIEWEEVGIDDSRAEEARRSLLAVDKTDRMCILLKLNAFD